MTLFRYRGVPISVHWSLIFLGAWWLFDPTRSFAQGLLEVVAIFGSVLLHEMGHMLAAESFGVRTVAITLHLMGGFAQIESRALTPMRDAVVSAAGPAVNVALALFFGGIGLLLDNHEIVFIGAVNIVLFVFNIIPAYPLDGGRVLAAGLTHFIGARRGLKITAAIGVVISVALFGVAFAMRDVLVGLIIVFLMIEQVGLWKYASGNVRR